jgi:EAL domain-containing protein (putative c-di-GMP-specific phosphodiesterase class I)
VAEGIEQPGQLAELRSLGTRMGQGYFFAKPLDPGEISLLLGPGALAAMTPHSFTGQEVS